MNARANLILARRSTRRAIASLAIACVAGLSVAAGVAPIARADTAPTVTAITPNTVASGSGAVTLDIAGTGIGGTSTVRWRGIDYPVNYSDYQVVDQNGDTHVTVTIPGSALSISERFLTVDVTVASGGAQSNPWPVTILGPSVTSAQSAIASVGATATVSTARLSASYTRVAAGYGTLTAVDYATPGDPNLPPNPVMPVALVDLQLRAAAAGDSLAGTFFPPDPILPPNPVAPSDPNLPPNPVRLAYWTGSAWAPVRSSGGVIPSFSFNYATTTASSAVVTFDATSTPQITALGGTIFAFVSAYGFVGFDDPVHSSMLNVAKAGRVVPLKWRVLDLGGNPVTGLTPQAVNISSVLVDCNSLSDQEEPVDAYAPGASGLQNLGDGYYQWNWATDGAWKGTCRRLKLDLGDRHPDGTPIYRTADFLFTR